MKRWKKVFYLFRERESKIFIHFHNFRVMVEKRTKMQLNYTRSNGGGEYFFDELPNDLQKHGNER